MYSDAICINQSKSTKLQHENSWSSLTTRISFHMGYWGCERKIKNNAVKCGNVIYTTRIQKAYVTGAYLHIPKPVPRFVKA